MNEGKTQHTKTMVYCESNYQQDVSTCKYLNQKKKKKEISQISNLTFHLRNLEKEEKLNTKETRGMQ